ncbi:MAG: PocR ligand-binding domain-containing protein [Bacteroidales bacterium]|nr:PocR ligand-binding domain-containing protein [Bacteroidales bacterium]MCF8458014.1 PocR ligand-binding domain-containing protein [Bacteroidales bacterium]
MDYKLADLIDIPLLQDLQEKLNSIYSFPSSIIDNDGKVLTAVAWQDICTKFHRTHPDCEKECIKSDQYILEHLHEANPAVSYQCPHGLIDNATPIIIDGKHLGNFFTGQFFLEKPDLEFFRKQAKKYGFDEKKYIEAVEKVPIWTTEKLAKYLDFIKGFIEIIAGFGLNQLKEIEAHKLIKESEERNQAIIQSTSDWIWEVDEQGKYTYCSEKIEQVLGYSEDEIIGKTPFDLMTLQERDRIIPIFQDIVKNKRSIVDLENWNLHKDGHKVCLLTNGFPIFDEAGNMTGFRGADKDITERKKAEVALRVSEEKFRIITENSPDAIFITDKEGNYLYANQMASQILGYTIDEITSQNIIDIGQQGKHGDRFQQLLKKGKLFAEMPLKKKDGTYIHVDLNAVILPNGMMYGSCRDLTERKKAEEELTKHREHLEELVKERTAELVEKNAELENFNNLFVGRELRIMALKDKVKELEKQLQEK